MTSERLTRAIEAIDAANARDPNQVVIGGQRRPAELVYGDRMSAALARLYPEATEAMQIAARGQHIERWVRPRSEYPMDRTGYLRWRGELRAHHATRVGEIMGGAGYPAEDIARVESLIRKHRLKRDEAAQALEDVVCVVFLEDYFADFAAKHQDTKVIEILRKTWPKMSAHGQAAALRLTLPPKARALVEAALNPDAPADPA